MSAPVAVDVDDVTAIATALCSVRAMDTEGPVAEVVADFLDIPGVEVLVDPVLPGRPNVVARLPGSGDGAGLLLNGHIDASYLPGWSHDPHEPWVADGRLYGAAITDMLGGVASMIATVRAVAAVKPPPGDLVLIANMHHDGNGLGTKYALASESHWPKYGINGEATKLTLMTAHGGAIKYEVAFRGRTAHVSRLGDAADALIAANAFFEELRGRGFTHQPHPLLPTLPVSVVGHMQAGRVPQAVADTAVLQGDVRTVPGMDWWSIRRDLDEVAKMTTQPGITTRIRCLVRQRPFVGPSGGPLVDAIAAAHRAVVGTDLLVNVERASQTFVTDAVDMQAAGIDTVVYGPGEWRAVPDEAMPISDLVNAAQVYGETAFRLSATSRATPGVPAT